MAAEDSLEINLILDEDGRTAPPATQASSTESYAPGICYTARACVCDAQADGDATFASLSNEVKEGLFLDCEIADAPMMPRTFWLPFTDMASPRCGLEALAANVFQRHVPTGQRFDPGVSGAEWWVQIRHSAAEDEAPGGICWHWDKDEEMRAASGMFVHPHISTVTYLAGAGAPTMVVSSRADFASGTPLLDLPIRQGIVSWPREGKHFSFDGRYLHGVPAELLGDIAHPTAAGTTQAGEEVARKRGKTAVQTRLTFLVNVWLNYRPLGIKPFPDSLAQKLSAASHVSSVLRKPCANPNCASKTVVVDDECREALQLGLKCTDGNYDLYLPMPAGAVAAAREDNGGTLEVVWEGSSRAVLHRADG